MDRPQLPQPEGVAEAGQAPAHRRASAQPLPADHGHLLEGSHRPAGAAEDLPARARLGLGSGRRPPPALADFHLAQRFAIDFSAKLDDQDRTHLGPNDENESYFNYGEPLLAVGAGKVVAAVDEYPDAVPPNSPGKVDFAQAGGNRVIIKLADGVFAGYGHMKPGSVRVQVGDRVRVGQVLGKLGNSGNSSGPHLHFQLMSRPSFLNADGLPFRLERFRLLGRVPSLEALIDNDLSGDPVPIDRSVAGRFRNTGFTDLDVVSFPGG
jgi:hypothetical protein